MDKKNILMVSIIVVCVVILVALGINAFASTGGNLTSYVSGGSCAGESAGGGCSPADKASCGSTGASAAPAGCGSSVSSAAGCGSSTSASAGGCGGSSAPSNIDFGRLEAEAVSYYSSQTGETGISAKAYNTTEGIEVAIIKDKKIIEVLSYGTR